MRTPESWVIQNGEKIQILSDDSLSFRAGGS